MNHGPLSEAVVPDKNLILQLCGFPREFKLGEEKVASAIQLGNVVCPPQGAFVAKFARSLLKFAGDGAQPGVALSSRYAIRPIRFSRRLPDAFPVSVGA